MNGEGGIRFVDLCGKNKEIISCFKNMWEKGERFKRKIKIYQENGSTVKRFRGI